MTATRGFDMSGVFFQRRDAENAEQSAENTLGVFLLFSALSLRSLRLCVEEIFPWCSFYPSWPTIAMPAALAASIIFGLSRINVRPASTARIVAPVSCIT